MRRNKSGPLSIVIQAICLSTLLFLVAVPPAWCDLDEQAEQQEKATVEEKQPEAEAKAKKEKKAKKVDDDTGVDDTANKLNIEKPGEDEAPDTSATVSGASTPKYKVALVLGGGGARGAAHVGVLKVLEKEKIPFDLIVGTSMGSVVGGFYSAGIPLKDIEEMFLDRSLMKAFMTVSLKVRMLASPIMILPRVVSHPYDGLYYGNKFRKYLSRQLPDDEKNIQDLKIPFAAVAVDLLSGNVACLTKGNLSYAMQASSAVPGLRKPVQIGEKLYVDGGITENVPVEQAKRMGADVIIAVNIDEKLEKLPIDHFRQMGSVSKRLITLQLRNLDKPAADQACVLIHPDLTGIGLLSTDGDDAARALAAGEKEATDMMPEIKRLLRKCGVDI
ncbi:MAG: patatin-like phospholipase family protein [Candidatus Obscuribacterales bacterium]|nr:patatin-like phospholipase family protein [Candidatus Obscuribacterales bacterium]